MTTIEVGKSLKDTDILWRYISLDKFIDLLDTKTLFFTPLAWYEKTDPFEGHVPPAVFSAIANLLKKESEKGLAMARQIEKNNPNTDRSKLFYKEEDAYKLPNEVISMCKNILPCIKVNCWYKSPHESSGMWNLYSKDGIAIKTTVGRISKSIRISDEKIILGPVKYIDYSRPDIDPKECLPDIGHFFGMIKRTAYDHEKEVRMLISPSGSFLTPIPPTPSRINVDIKYLIEEIKISPFASETIASSIRAVCRWAGIDEEIVTRSNLLDNCQDLLELLNPQRT